MTASIPARLGKYPITGVLGKGAMGIVYRGSDPVIKRPVAIKTIRKELIDDDERTETLSTRFRREAQAAGALCHPGIVSVYEYGEDAEHAYIAMEYVEGNSLREYLGSGAIFDEHDTVSIMAQLLDALQFAHDHTVWHRDIKPANILLMRNGRIKLTDFGIARIEASDRTKTNVVMGTPGYIAPEMYLGGQIDHRVDIFSAGVLFYNLLCGQTPFRGRSEAVMHDVCYHDPVPPSSVESGRRWPQYDAVVARALEKAPADRFQSAAEFRAAIVAQYAEPLNSTLSDATIVSTVLRPVGAVSPAPPTRTVAVAAPASANSTPPPTGWSAPVLAGVEVELARFVGPVARVLVRRAAREAKDIDSLTAAVVESIDRPADREAFVRAVTGRSRGSLQSRLGAETPVPAGPGSGSGSGTGTGGPLTTDDLERTTRLLVHYIGPIARVVARRAAAAGISRDDFLQRVAQSVDDDANRQRFLQEARVANG
jgi:eukaryotic-like serine/threonine-protein kinase